MMMKLIYKRAKLFDGKKDDDGNYLDYAALYAFITFEECCKEMANNFNDEWIGTGEVAEHVWNTDLHVRLALHKEMGAYLEKCIDRQYDEYEYNKASFCPWCGKAITTSCKRGLIVIEKIVTKKEQKQVNIWTKEETSYNIEGL